MWSKLLIASTAAVVLAVASAGASGSTSYCVRDGLDKPTAMPRRNEGHNTLKCDEGCNRFVTALEDLAIDSRPYSEFQNVDRINCYGFNCGGQSPTLKNYCWEDIELEDATKVQPGTTAHLPGQGTPYVNNHYDDWHIKCSTANGKPQVITGFRHSNGNDDSATVNTIRCAEVCGAEVAIDEGDCQYISVGANEEDSEAVQAIQWGDESWVNLGDLPTGLRKCPMNYVLVALAENIGSGGTIDSDMDIEYALCCRLKYTVSPGNTTTRRLRAA